MISQRDLPNFDNVFFYFIGELGKTLFTYITYFWKHVNIFFLKRPYTASTKMCKRVIRNGKSRQYRQIIFQR